MTDLVVQNNTNDLTARMTYAKALAASNLLPRDYRQNPANVLVAIEYGNALGLAPMVAIQTIHVVDGKPTASAQLIGSLVRRAGHRLRVTGDSKHAIAEIVRSDDPDYTFRSEWTIGRAQAAKLTGKGVWTQYPDAMLKARAITEVARDACPEVLAGVAYTPEELGVDDASHGSFVATEPTPAFVEAQTYTASSSWDAEPVEGDIEQAPDFVPCSGKQRAYITAQFSKKAIEIDIPMSPIGILDVLSRYVSRDLESLEDLSKDEASDIIDKLLNSNEIRDLMAAVYDEKVANEG
jgi:hypothetical protein